MPTTLVLRFPWGRYHATPWARHVNEGAVELPPSPWRLLRALYAVWRTRIPELDEDLMHRLLATLAVPPTFYIPRHGLSHTRHYYPDMAHRSGAPSTDRTLDAFAVFERGAELAVRWHVELTEDHRTALERLAGAIPYFGRADSVCDGFLAAEWEPTGHDRWEPLDVAESVDEDAVVTSVLAPELPLRLDSLLARPLDVRKGGLLFPAGTHLLAYQRSAEAPRTRPQPRRRAEPVTAVRFSVLQAGLPPQIDSLIYTDLLRQGALSKLGGLREERARTQLGGRTADDTPMEGHGHAHYLPLVTEDRRLSGLVVWVRNGLPDDELKALTRVDRLYTPVNPDWRLTIRVAGIGTPAQVAPELVAQRSATVWRSVTPFTPSRYPKRHAGQLDYLRTEIGYELRNRTLPTLRALTLLDEPWQPWRRYRQSARMRRNTRQGQVTHPAAFLRIEFAEPIHGPLALGHLSHFGLGLFLPEAEGRGCG
ncbi:MAG: type I-U CRISPR-associated protein Csb2 [Actinomycetota bacterium]|nr:type I-U CRISPR-associated protein Csb2 [Actinomycetota bacterium]